MARRPRADSAGSWHHVINRAIAKRPYFETRSDKRYFLSRLVKEVRAGRLEVHSFCLLTTHFHLLVRSPIGEMSEALRRAQCSYSRYFNRRRRRDGPLIRARFFSKRVDSDCYRRTVVRYIDANAVRAGLVATAGEHEFGSARHYLAGPRPRWLSTEWVTQRATKHSGAAEFSPSAYLATFGARAGEDLESLCSMVEMRMASACELDPFEDLVGSTPLQIHEWMIRKAKLADGMKIGLPVCGPSAVRGALDGYVQAHGDWFVDSQSCTWQGPELAWPGLLRDLCSLPFSQVAHVCNLTRWEAKKRIGIHRQLVREEGGYAGVVSGLAREALGATPYENRRSSPVAP